MINYWQQELSQNWFALAMVAFIACVAILAAHGTLQELCSIRVTWRITDSIQGRMWLSFGVVLLATSPAHIETLPVWLAMLTVLAFTAALYVFLDRVALLPIPHVVRLTASITSRRSTFIDSRKPAGHRWVNNRMMGAWA